MTQVFTGRVTWRVTGIQERAQRRDMFRHGDTVNNRAAQRRVCRVGDRTRVQHDVTGRTAPRHFRLGTVDSEADSQTSC